MKVAFIGATGELAKRILPELSGRGHTVTAISIHPEKTQQLPGVAAVMGNASDTKELVPLLKGHDVVVSSVRFDKYDQQALIDAVRQSGVPRYFVCGGSGTLLAPGTQTRIMDTPQFPPAYATFAKNAARFFDFLQAQKDLNWTYISPPPGFAPGERTGKFRVGKDELLVGADGKAAISYEDYAIAVVDELETPKHRGRFTVGY